MIKCEKQKRLCEYATKKQTNKKQTNKRKANTQTS